MMKNEAIQTPVEHYEEALLEAAFTEMLLEEYEALESQPLTDEERALLARAEAELPERLAQLARSVRRPNPIAALWRKSGTVLKYVAVLLLAATVSLGAALAFHDGFRTRVVEFLTDLTDDYVGVGMTQGNAPLNRPEGWLAPYFPAYMPEGYVLEEYYSSDIRSWLNFVDNTGNCIIVEISAEQLNVFLNNHDAAYTMIRINDTDVITWYSNDRHYITWQLEGYVICVSAPELALCMSVVHSVK